MENTIGYKRQAEKELISYQAEVEGYMDSLYELLTMQEPELGRQIMGTFNDILYGENTEE